MASGLTTKINTDTAIITQEKAERTKEGERVLKEVAALAESRGYDAAALQYFSEQ